MIKYYFCLILCLLITTTQAQKQRQVDSSAVRLLDKMTSIIGELNSLSVEVASENDVLNDLFENERQFGHHKLHFSGPSKMSIHSTGHKGNRAIWYNGDFLTYYSFDENNYVRLKAPETTIATIDSINNTFDIKFPAADIFYPNLTDDILNYFNHLKFLGLKTIDGVECFHVMASNSEMTFQIWIENNALYLPKRYLFIDKNNNYQQHEGVFSNWQLNPFIPDTVFDFTPPKNARLISIMSKS